MTFLKASSRLVVLTRAGGDRGLPYFEHAFLSYSVIAKQPENLDFYSISQNVTNKVVTKIIEKVWGY